jgi:hypothetical protein
MRTRMGWRRAYRAIPVVVGEKFGQRVIVR